MYILLSNHGKIGCEIVGVSTKIVFLLNKVHVQHIDIIIDKQYMFVL